jgi:hypothetical protein
VSGSRDELTGALEELEKLIPDQDDGDSNAEWRAELIKRYGSVTSFLGLLAQLELGAVDARAPPPEDQADQQGQALPARPREPRRLPPAQTGDDPPDPLGTH